MAGCCGNQSTNKKKWVLPVAVVAIVVIVVLIGIIQGNNGSNFDGNNASTSDSQTIKEGESLVTPISEISETPSYYTFEIDGVTMEVVALKASDGTIRTAYNTCQVCNGSPKAYFVQSGNTLQCQNCGNKFPLDKVGLEKGGCNPAPIIDEDKIVTDESITISYDVLNAEKDNFTNWKKGL